MTAANQLKIVENGLKVDFHIHSCFSYHKDGDIVINNTIKNASILIDKLVYEKIEMFSITDHDCFSYDLYKKFKEYEDYKTIKKVFPAVEFSVYFKRDGGNASILHLICIFNDSDTLKVSKIENVLKITNGKPEYDYENSAFTEAKFLQILNDIDLDVVLIAHQKKSLLSQQNPDEHDVNSLGKECFNEFVFSEYFEAFEFKNKRNEVFNNSYKSEFKGDMLRFITGSDCHDWTIYPKARIEDKTKNSYTYFKCLPTFRGLTLALTDESRIQHVDNFFSVDDNYIDKIELKINGVKKDIKLSKGINVIIGDNSVGKSLILHKLTDYQYSQKIVSPKIKDGYENYLKEKNIEILSRIDENKILLFDTQGEIRRKFNLSQLKANDFFKDKYPIDIDTQVVKSIILNKLDEVCNSITAKFNYDDNVKGIKNIKVHLSNDILSNYNLIKIGESFMSEEGSDISKICSQIETVKIELIKLDNLLLEEHEKEEISNFLHFLEALKNKYSLQSNNFQNMKMILNSINKVFDNYDSKIQKLRTKNEAAVSNYISDKSALIDSIVSTVCILKCQSKPNLNIQEYKIEPNVNEYLTYKFISKIGIDKIDSKYLENLINKPLKVGFSINYDSITKEKLLNGIKDVGDEKDPVQVFKSKIIKLIESDFSSVNTIVEENMDVKKRLSEGFNVKIYFSILSSQGNKKGIYIIDQPEDDVSQNAIKKYILSDFKRMSHKRQIIIVTHNPQFVVNIDADNIISLSTNSKSEIEIHSGALEFECKEYKVLDLVANGLDGGLETIRKRWKRYEKIINF